MSDNESDSSEGELLKDWTLVRDIDDYGVSNLDTNLTITTIAHSYVYSD
jgi:hypothetical protein